MPNYVVGLLFSMNMQDVVLLKKREGSKHFGGMWNGVGGGIQAKEKEYSLNTDKLLKRNWDDASIAAWVNSRGGTPIFETPHAAMSREFKEETGVFIAPERWHCFNIQNWKHTRTKVYWMWGADPEMTQCHTVTDEEVKIVDWTMVSWMGREVAYDLHYHIEMCVRHVRAGDLLCLDPEGINLEKQNPTSVMGSDDSNAPGLCNSGS